MYFISILIELKGSPSDLEKATSSSKWVGEPDYLLPDRWPLSFTRGPLELNRTAIYMHTYLHTQADYLAQFIFKKHFAFSSKERLGLLPISAFCKQANFRDHVKGNIF